MSSSRRREEMEVGVGDSAESVSRILPFLLMNCRSKLGVNAGPKPTASQRCCESIFELKYLLTSGEARGCGQMFAPHVETKRASRSWETRK